MLVLIEFNQYTDIQNIMKAAYIAQQKGLIDWYAVRSSEMLDPSYAFCGLHHITNYINGLIIQVNDIEKVRDEFRFITLREYKLS